MITLNRKKAIDILSHKMADNWNLSDLWKSFRNGIIAVNTYTNELLIEELKEYDETEEYEIVDWKDLGIGEIIQDGDEFYNPLLGWIMLQDNEYCVNSDIGEPVQDNGFPMRRKTTWK